jgi:hypothetical protein
MNLPNPNNQYELLLHTLIEFTSNLKGKELSMSYWMQHYRSHKFSTRLGDVENDLNIKLVKREFKKFTNRFGHHSKYRVYIPILEHSEYVRIYLEYKESNVIKSV